MKKLLITGFDPFGGESVNPAYEAVRLLPDVVAEIKLCKLKVPTEFVRSGAVLRDALAANLQKEPYAAMRAQLLGPAPASVARVNYSYRYQLTLVCRNSAPLRKLLAFLLVEFSKDKQNKGLTAFIDINSYN